jgi:hypothetical protein
MDFSKIPQNGVGLVATALLALSSPAAADPLIHQGASTFNRQIIESHLGLIHKPHVIDVSVG